MKMLENLSPSLASSPPLYPFGVFLRFLPSRPSWTLAVLCRNSIAFTGAFPFSTRTNRTAGIQLKESTSKGNHLDQREREKEREGDGQYDSRETFVASRREVERGRRDRDRRSSISIKAELVPRFFLLLSVCHSH